MCINSEAPPAEITDTCTPIDTWTNDYSILGEICGCSTDWEGNREPLIVIEPGLCGKSR